MYAVRVLMGDVAPGVADELRAKLAAQPDMTLEDCGSCRAVELLLAAESTGADVVILGRREEEVPGVVSHLHAEFPRVKILTVDATGRDWHVCDAGERVTRLDVDSVDTAIGVIRGLVAGEVVSGEW